MTSYSLIGVMSGTSTDGLDLAYTTFSPVSKSSEKWSFELHHAKTYPYPEELIRSIRQAKELNGYALKELDIILGKFIGETVNRFVDEFSIDRTAVHAVASHGHTIFHQPSERITVQIGNGQVIASLTGIKTINNFREKDVLSGGQGAPLVPIGDLLLFSDLADSFLNLGGFANITSIRNNTPIAFDICPCNLPLNMYASLIGYPYDHNGELGRSVPNHNTGLVSTLNHLPYYSKKWPKSLGVEWLEEEFAPLLEIDELTAQEKLRICYDHISEQIAGSIRELQAQKVLVTGGGAKNKFLVELIRQKSNSEILIPDSQLIDFKEAIVFAFLGVLFLIGQPNCLKSVTGADRDVCGGNEFLP